ncbi:5693_t:CDS:2 [Entrophospora sp. SA101]|nr:6789_t:CDS:2 [Entrophospora sp. SA101]CAJ0632429.1 7499_t:CDS:2 [Entrophospora sp. SA101]CAJ0756610.1 5693_t:CDS:2 [Entrophospora sp. SA101]CAJ0846409.1 8181_t:CDS:2 [Entrophospora sp. SA101]CAJ0847618.1 15966_t:CDS:2 [Entrophospora sp. SA101]
MSAFRNFRNSRRYINLSDDTGYTDEQFQRPLYPAPWKSIALAAGLFVVGSLGIIFGSLIMAGIVSDEAWDDRGKPILFLGSLLFIPGFYHVRLAYYAYKGYDGYDFNQIPDW